MNGIKSLIKNKKLQANNQEINNNTLRDGDTSVREERLDFSSLDGRTLRRKGRWNQFNTKISDKIRKGINKLAIERNMTITEITENAFENYFEKMGLKGY